MMTQIAQKKGDKMRAIKRNVDVQTGLSTCQSYTNNMTNITVLRIVCVPNPFCHTFKAKRFSNVLNSNDGYPN